MRKRFPWWVLAIPASLIFVVIALYFITAKWEQGHVEARTRCADPTIRKDRTVEQCVSYLMSYYHIYSQLPKVGFGAVVSAQPQPKAQPLSMVRQPILTEVVENNVYLFTPGDDGETSDDVQLDRVLRNIGDKYRITGLVITERKRYVAGNLASLGIAQARIIVEPK
jgi:hypothetical protein